ncbi:hypothetical protein C6P40_001448 [Pichia californica]|uniref:RWD domain-containing protein n=1 Tax=Pichia californica TaxID=460514 RepID=A0A9P6WLS4_9ASCO|nr:hypothetical protein C6P42_001562 [[Candida] californica]KAG0688073.1 hypothetical protein C6P40_001448 [[Candida] californica]
MSRITSPYDSITFGNPLSLRVDSNYLSVMSISPCGRDAVLAGRKGLLVIDLDDPFAAPRWLHHETSWEVADVQWSPHVSKPSWVVSTSNQKAMVWNLARSSNDAIEYVLHSHIRAITDIQFHPQNPEMLATCSVDTFVLAWDLRSPKEPVQQWSEWRAAASQVKWNYNDPNIIASSHDNNILIWDMRKGAIPMKKLQGHDAKINGLDWSRENKYDLITSSNDMSVKFWSFDKEYEKPVYTIRTDFPVARTRHVPFGDHVCGIMPLRGGNDSIYIVDYKGKVGESRLEPDYVFKGHTEPVKDFLWRSRHSSNTSIDDSEYQLVTWSSDRDLRLWPLNDEMYNTFNYKRNQPLPSGKKLSDYEYKTYRPDSYVSTDNKLIVRHRNNRYNGTSYGDSYKANSEFNHLNWISGIKIGQSAFQNVDNDPNSATFGDNSNQPLNLGEEVSNVGHKFPKLRFERISVSTGVLVISLNGPWSSQDKEDLIFIRVEFNFPKGYPSPKAIPKFKVEETHELTFEKKQDILKNLQEISTKFCSHKRFCLEPCLRFLLGEKVDIDFEVEESLDTYDLEYKDNKDDDLISVIPAASDSEFEVDNDDNIEEEEEDDDDEEEDEDDDEYDVIDGAAIKAANIKKAPFDSTPVSKGCGAIWTPSGHVVCFFISKETNDDQHMIKFGQQGFSLVRNLKRKHVENGLQIGKKGFIDGALSNNTDSDSDSSSSDDSLSNDFDVFQYNRMYRRNKVPDLLRNANLNARQYSSNAKSNPMSAPTERSQVTSTSKLQSTKNVVKIYDFRHLIPAKMELAYEYRVLGDSPHILAQYNSEIADKYGYSTIADCWKILSIILVKDVAIDEANAHSILEKIGQSTHNMELVRNYRFYWGFHPFGGVWLVKQLFNYFKKINDIQMLAMLSCVLFENDIIKDRVNIPINSPFVRTDNDSDIKKSILRNASTVHNPTQVARSIYNGITGGNNGGNIIQPPQLMRNQSTVSFDRKNSRSVLNYNSNSSPMYISNYRMPSVSTLSSFEYDNKSFKSSSPAGDMTLLINNNNSVNMNGNIPYNRRGIKHQSITGVGTSFDHLNAYDGISNTPQLSRSISAASLNVFNQQFGKVLNTNKGVNNNNNNTDIPIVNIQMVNFAELDLYENEYCVNIEGFVDPEELKIYRAEYASILFCWGLRANRLKILKFNYNNSNNKYERIEYSKNESDYKEHYGEIGWCYDSKISLEDTPQVKWIKTHEKNKCHFCDLEVTKRLSVCTKCNHIMHDVCSIVWWEEDGMAECPSGCGCQCLNQHVVV